MTDVKYVYLMNEMGGEDFITISFLMNDNLDWFESNNFKNPDETIEKITLFNITNPHPNNISNFDFESVKRIALDYASDPFLSFNLKYTNSKVLRVYSVEFIERDLDRGTIQYKVTGYYENFDLQRYKRELKIQSILK